MGIYYVKIDYGVVDDLGHIVCIAVILIRSYVF